MKIYDNMTALVGHTPLVRLHHLEELYHLPVELVAKVEAFNPLGSAKDRVGLALIEDAEQKGLLQKGATVIEPTSGNTGVGLAFVCALKGYTLI
ncbi:MAG: pyridoxal-phosphate dependent enzyme, partial [Acutalibacteraceae bacterium]